MAKKSSAGILCYTIENGVYSFLLVHPGGPYHANKDLGNWDLPKGKIEENEDIKDTALREFEEETGVDIKLFADQLIDIGTVKLKSGKTIYGFALDKKIDTTIMTSNECYMEWPKDSDQWIVFPEVEGHNYFEEEVANEKIRKPLNEFIKRIKEL